jgi:hypothetical protein
MLTIRKPKDLWSDDAVEFLKAWKKDTLFRLLKKVKR